MRSGDVRTVGDELRDLAARLGVELQTEGEPYERFRARVRDAWEWEADMAQLLRRLQGSQLQQKPTNILNIP